MTFLPPFPSLARAGWLLAASLCAFGLEPASAAQDSGSAVPAAKVQYARVGPQGAQAKNLADSGAVTVLDLAPGSLLAVYGERAGWLDAEAAGGFKVWIFGDYVEPSSEAGQLVITANDVRMRPLPSNGVDSYYLRQTLAKGVKVRYIGRNDSTKPLEQDWVQVWSPPGARAWVKADQTVPLSSGEAGPALWAKAVKELEAAAKPALVKLGDDATAVPAAATAEDPKRAAAALRAADDVLAAERMKHEQKLSPQYPLVRSAYEKVLALASSGSVAEAARAKLTLVGELEKAYQTEIDLEAERARRVAELKRREEAMVSARTRDSLEGRFDARGWLEKRTIKGETNPVYVLSFSGASAAEIVCYSGRYDLDVFVGHEIGVFGSELRGPLKGELSEVPRAAQLDVNRIEVLAARAPGVLR
jgi:hypothetical protein